MTKHLVTLLALLLATGPAAAAPGRTLRVMVYDLKAEGIPDRVARFTTEALVAEIRKLEAVQVSSMVEFDELLSFEEQRRLVGCTDEVCLTEIAAALGVDQIVIGSLQATGTSHLMNLQRFGLGKTTAMATVSRQLVRKDGEEFLAEVGAAVEQLFPEHALKPGRTRGVKPEVARRLNPPPLPRWSFLAVAGGSALCLGAGAAAGLSSRTAGQLYNTLSAGTVAQPAKARDLAAQEDLAGSRATLANGLFVGGGALALSAGVMAFFVDWSPPPEKSTRLALIPAPSGFALAGTFP